MWEELSMSRRLLAVLGVLATAFVLAANAADQAPIKITPKNKGDVKRTDDRADPKIKIEDAANQQEMLKQRFNDFKQQLLALALRLEGSSKAEDREKAKILRQAIKKASEEGVETQFSSLIDMLRSNDAVKNIDQLDGILKENEKLRRNLRDILELLLKDDRDAQLKREIAEKQKLLEELKNIIRKQELVLNKTIQNRTANKDLEKSQNKVRNETHDLVNPKSNRGSEAKQGEGKGNKSGKEGIGEAKNDTKDPKADAKDPKGGEGKDGKSGEGKDGKGGEGKDPKSGEGKDGKGGEGKDGKPGEGKDGKGGEGKDGKSGEGKDGKGGEGKDGKPGEGKDGKPGEGKDGKPGEGKNGKPGDPKPGAGKPGDAKPGSGKPGAGKPGESKPGAGKPGEGKQGDSKGKGEGKGDPKGGSGKSGQGKPGEGKPGQSGQSGQPGQQGQQGEGKSGGKSGQQPPQQQPNQEQSQIKKQIQDAEKHQQQAEDKLRKDQRKPAAEDEDVALQKLQEAKKKLEDLLRQLREEEIERLLTKLEARCRQMLAMQIAVRDSTVELDKTIKATDAKDEQGTRANRQASNTLSDKENDIVKEANAGLRLLEAEGSAVAFAEVFQQVRGDMQTVAVRLGKTDTGVVTVTIENQIIETLQEMIEALKKAQADNKNKPKPGQPGQSGQPPDPKLIDLLAELKMIRSMQKRVNSRTELYGKQYSGEQAPPPEKASSETERETFDRIQTELKDLSKRQQKISKVTHDIATGKNEAK
jgi:hypothetical protein